tara:strand:- start:4273 stop:5193 length:921 start_codon:yes stop_codon:yes gene_type:complete
MLLVVTGALLSSVWFWYSCNLELWFASVFVTILAATVCDMQQCFQDVFLSHALQSMKPTQCCTMVGRFDDPRYVLRTTMALRVLAGLMAGSAVIISCYFKKDFSTGHYLVVSGCWVAVCTVWFVSCVPLVVSLLQCAAATTTDTVVRYRKVVTIWVVHDLFLGMFWLYLAIMLYDLADDSDDSEWRTIFLSMISWHLIILVLHFFYMKKTDTRMQLGQTCCGPNSAQAWLRFFLLLSFVGMYIVIISRMQHNDLSKMGLSDGQMGLFVLATLMAGFCKTQVRKLERIPVHPVPSVTSRLNQHNLMF